MSVKCPACGFDSSDEARWCDFCKEPFKKKTSETAPKSVPPAPAAEPKRPALKYYQPLPAKQPPPAPPPPPLPPELDMKLKDDEKVPEVPPWFRYFAWAFLGVWIIAGMVLAGILYARYKSREEAPPAPAPQFPRP